MTGEYKLEGLTKKEKEKIKKEREKVIYGSIKKQQSK